VRRRILIIFFLALFLVFGTTVVCVGPTVKAYWDGNRAFQAGDYETAIKKYETADHFMKSEEMVRKCYYAMAEEQMPVSFEEGWALQTFHAAEILAKAGKDAETNRKIFDCGMMLLSHDEYRQADNTFALLESAEGEAYSNVSRGMQQWGQERYEKAISSFEMAKAWMPEQITYDVGDEEPLDIDKMIYAGKLIEAEKHFAAGELLQARAEYEQLPIEFSYDEISVSKRLSQLERHRELAALCGKWMCDWLPGIEDRGEIMIRQIPKRGGEKKGWRRDAAPNTKERCLEIRCEIIDEEYAVLKFSATMEFYQNWQDYSKDLKDTDLTIEFGVLVDVDREAFQDGGTHKKVWVDKRVVHPNDPLLPDPEEDTYAEFSYNGDCFEVSYSYLVDNYHIDYDYEQSSRFVYNRKIADY